MGEGRGCREQNPTARSAQGGDPCLTKVSHSSLLGRRCLGEGPSVPLHQPRDSGAQGPGACVLATPKLRWLSLSLRLLQEAGATGLACRDACSRLLTRSSVRTSGGLGVRNNLLMSIGRLRTGRVAVFRCVWGYGRRRAWRTIVSPSRWTLFPLRPLHAWLVLCWPACVWSVDGRLVVSGAVLLVHGCVSRLMVGLSAVGSSVLQPVLVQPDVVRVVISAVSALVACAVVGLWAPRGVWLSIVLGRWIDEVC